MKKNALVTILLASLVLTGCSIKLGGSTTKGIEGVFKSVDSGDNWIEKNLFVYSGGMGSMAGVDVMSLNFDPQDNNAIYLGSAEDGLFYTYDGGESWSKANGVPNGRIESVAVDPKNKCIIYSTFTNTILKSVDCSRSWKEVYIDTRPDKALTALAVDFYDNLIVYAGNTVGDILKSGDGGIHWQVIKRFDSKIFKIMIDPSDSRIIYVATSSKGIFKTIDSGANWLDINDGLKPYSGAFEYRSLIFNPSESNSLILAAKYGLIKTNDGGQTWEALQLITPPATTDIFAVAVSPENSKEMYYTTSTTFYKTIDGGQNWITKRLPTLAIPSSIIINPNYPGVMYMGITSSPRR